jgi:hypothetical protein
LWLQCERNHVFVTYVFCKGCSTRLSQYRGRWLTCTRTRQQRSTRRSSHEKQTAPTTYEQGLLFFMESSCSSGTVSSFHCSMQQPATRATASAGAKP